MDSDYYRLTRELDKLNEDHSRSDPDEAAQMERAFEAPACQFARSMLRASVLVTNVYIEYPATIKRRLASESLLPSWLIEGHFMRFYSPFNRLSKEVPVKNPPKVYLTHLFFVYIILKTLLFISINLCLTRGTQRWKPDLSGLKADVDFTDNCVKLGALMERDRKHIEWLTELRASINVVGFALTAPNEFLPFVMTLFTFALVILMVMAQVHGDNPNFRLYAITTILHPEIERARVTAGLKDIIDCMLNRHEISSSPPVEQNMRSVSPNTRMDHIRLSHVDRQAHTMDGKRGERDRFIHSFIRERHKLMLRPAHLSLASYRKIIRVAAGITVGCMIASWIIGGVALAGLFPGEIKGRLHQRLNEAECKHWHPLAVSRKWPARIPDSGLSSATKSEQGNRSQIAHKDIQLNDIFTEVGNLFSQPAAYIYYMEMIYIYVYVSFWTSIYYVFVGINHECRSIWIQQIDRQLELAEKLIDQSKKLLLKAQRQTTHASIQERLLSHQIKRALTMAYLNFVLYRRDQHYYRSIFKFLGLQLSMVVLLTCLLGLLFLGTSRDRNQAVIMCMLVCWTSIMNYIWYLNVSVISQIQSIFKRVDLIIAKCTSDQTGHHKVENSYILGLWRRQNLTASEIERVFGINILGIQLSQEIQIQFNSYILGALIYMSRTYA